MKSLTRIAGLGLIALALSFNGIVGCGSSSSGSTDNPQLNALALIIASFDALYGVPLVTNENGDATEGDVACAGGGTVSFDTATVTLTYASCNSGSDTMTGTAQATSNGSVYVFDMDISSALGVDFALTGGLSGIGENGGSNITLDTVANIANNAYHAQGPMSATDGASSFSLDGTVTIAENSQTIVTCTFTNVSLQNFTCEEMASACGLATSLCQQ